MQQDAAIRLTFSATVAVIIHAIALPALDVATSNPVQPNPKDRADVQQRLVSEREERGREAPARPTPPLKLGRDEASQVTTMAWISYDHFQELLGRKAPTPQPALQSEVDPTPEAPLTSEPITPHAPVTEAPSPVPAVAAVAELDASSAETEPSQIEENSHENMDAADIAPGPFAKDGGAPLREVEVANARHVPAIESEEEMIQASVGQNAESTEPSPSNRSEEVNEKPADTVSPATPVQAASTPKPPVPVTTRKPEKSQPTQAAKSERESDLFAKKEAMAVQPGKVLTSGGIEIKTVRPRFSTIATQFSAPRNPIASIKFDHKTGMVLSAKLERSTGYPNVDGPILTSLYGWIVSGNKLAELKGPFTIRMTITLVR